MQIVVEGAGCPNSWARQVTCADTLYFETPRPNAPWLTKFDPETRDVDVTVLDQYGQSMDSIEFTLSADGGVATVDEDGIVTPITGGYGQVVIDAGGQLSKTLTVVVNTAPVPSKNSWREPLRVEPGGTVEVDMDGDFTDLDGDPLAYWLWQRASKGVPEFVTVDFVGGELLTPPGWSEPVTVFEDGESPVLRITAGDKDAPWDSTIVTVKAVDPWNVATVARFVITVGCPLLQEEFGGSSFDIEIEIGGKPSWLTEPQDAECSRRALQAAELWWENALDGSDALYEEGERLTITVDELEHHFYAGLAGPVDGLDVETRARPARGWVSLNAMALHEPVRFNNTAVFGGIHDPNDGEPVEEPRAFSPSRFYNVARHEIGHVLGIGAGEIWDSLLRDKRQSHGPVTDVHFAGATARDVFTDLAPTYTGAVVPVQNQQNFGEILSSHWRQGVLAGDLMSPHGGNAISMVTLAALSDMGWIVNLEAAEQLECPISSSRRSEVCDGTGSESNSVAASSVEQPWDAVRQPKRGGRKQ